MRGRDPRLREAPDQKAARAGAWHQPSQSARFFLPFRPLVSAGSAKCASAPTRSSSSTTNRQPVVASNATSRPTPLNRVRNFRTPALL